MTFIVPEGSIIEVKQSITVINAPASTEPEDGLWNTEQAAAYIGVHVKTLQKWVRLGKFPRIPLPGAGKDFRFSKAKIDRWLEERSLK
jgi:excisionase family DNA binding protein